MLHCEAEVSDFDLLIPEEDVSRLEVSVDDSLVVYVVVAVDDLVHERDGLVLGEAAAAGDEFGKIAAIAEFGDDVCIVFGVIDVINFYDVLAVLEAFEYLYL